MTKKELRQILSKDFGLDMINSCMAGRRKPNGQKRNEYQKKYSIPFEAWDDIKSFLHNKNTKKANNNTSIKG